MHDTQAEFQDFNTGCFCESHQNVSTPYDAFFAKTQVFVSGDVYSKIMQSIDVLEKAIMSKDFKRSIFKDRYDEIQDMNIDGGVFMSYDFHIDGNTPKLIEINTNAGGAFLNYELLKVVRGCCDKITVQDVSSFEDAIVSMFRAEYKKKSDKELEMVVIVDEEPEKQFLYPEFLLCKDVLERNGVKVYIVDPKDLNVEGEELFVDIVKVDLLYNRLTDFSFEKEEHIKFLSLLSSSSTVVTPSKDDHMLFADKRSLLALGDESLTSQILSSDELVTLKETLLETKIVDETNAEYLWEHRKKYFFKPFNGYGGRGAYNGKGLTKQVWENIKEGNYLAQEIIPANVRMTKGGDDEEMEAYKFDIRAYTYKGKILLLAARMYQGQTTNFRTVGGGFAPVMITNK